MRRLFRFNKEEDENFTGYYQRTARAARTIWTRMKLPFLSEVSAESMWRAMGLACDPKPNVVLTTLRRAFTWRCTKWWQNTKAIEMRNDPCKLHEMETHVGLAQSWVCLGQRRHRMGW